MDISTVISIVVLLFVGFYDFFAYKLKFIKKYSSEINHKRSLSKAIIPLILYTPLALVFNVIVDYINSPKYNLKGGYYYENLTDIDYYLSFFDIKKEFTDELDFVLITNYIIFTVIYSLLCFFSIRSRITISSILKLYFTKKNLAIIILIVLLIFLTKPILTYFFEPARVRSYIPLN